MSFSQDVKTELSQLDMGQEHCRLAEAYGMLLFGGSFTNNTIGMRTEHPPVGKRYAGHIAWLTGKLPKQETFPSGHIRLELLDEENCNQILSAFGYTGKEYAYRLKGNLIYPEGCPNAFFRGVFLVCGTITSPEKEYHMEFSVPFPGLADELQQMMEEHSFFPKQIQRKGYTVLYFKESETIEDMLTFMGATNGTLELMNVKIYKDMRNKVNRQTNFETANLNKTASASAKQIAAIEQIAASRGMTSLPEELRELAVLRLENPDLSLRELGETLSTPLSRSGVYRRLEKIQDLAERQNKKRSIGS